jgi:hypothetical protein
MIRISKEEIEFFINNFSGGRATSIDGFID